MKKLYLLGAACACASILFSTSLLASVLNGFVLTDTIDAGAARPGIAMGGIHYDEINDWLYVVGNSDFNTTAANFYKFDSSGTPLFETEIATGGQTITSLAGIPNTTDLFIGYGASVLSRITQNGAIVNSVSLPGIQQIAGLAINPTTNNLWIAESIGNTDFLYELDSAFNILNTMSYSSLSSSNILGLDIDPVTGNFIASLSGPNKLVEFSSDLSGVVSELMISDPNFSGLTSLSLSLSASSDVLYVSSGSSDIIFEFSAVPIPPALWLFGSGLLSLIGMARCKKA